MQHPRCPLNRHNCSCGHTLWVQSLSHHQTQNQGERPDPKTRDHSSALPSDLWVFRTGVASPKTSRAAQGGLALVTSLPTSCLSIPTDRQTSLAALSPARRGLSPLQSHHTARVPLHPEDEEGPRGSAGVHQQPWARDPKASHVPMEQKKITRGKPLPPLIGQRRHGPDLELGNCARSQNKQFPKSQRFRFLFERKRPAGTKTFPPRGWRGARGWPGRPREKLPHCSARRP